MQSTDYLDTGEAASFLKISASSLNKRRVSGDGPLFVKMGRTVRYRRSDLDDWMANRLCKSTSDKRPFGSPPDKNEIERLRNPGHTTKRRGAAEPAP
jgi:predicted DNA-binding transcriptional regulator AlpA